MLRNRCAFWNCGRSIRGDHFLCADHYADLQDDLIDECPRCRRFKDAEYELCLDCRNRRPVVNQRPVKPVGEARAKYKPERSKAWERNDAAADRFFVYILKLGNGNYYVGHTRELRERLSEHRDGKERATAGHRPKLMYFEILPTRETAASREVDLKKLNDSNQREIRRMIISFHDLVKEVNLD